MSRKVLLISYSFPPDNAPAARRPYLLAKYLSKSIENEVHVLIPSSSHSSLGKSNLDEDYLFTLHKTSAFFRRDKNNHIENINRENLAEGTIFSNYFKKFASKLLYPDKGVFWLLKALNKALKLADEILPDP
jgi:hypothetical protein